MFRTTNLILIIDRDNEVLELLRTALESVDCVLLQAKTSEGALGVLSRLNSQIDLTVIDLELCTADVLFSGLLAMARDRKLATKIIVKTSRHVKPFLEQVNYSGVDAIVLKPISEEELIKTVQATMSGRRTVAGTAA